METVAHVVKGVLDAVGNDSGRCRRGGLDDERLKVGRFCSHRKLPVTLHVGIDRYADAS